MTTPERPPRVLSVRFEAALADAARLHLDQCRKGTTIPYISHLLVVAGLVLEDGGTEDEAIAALLHDAVEDQDETPDHIAARYGPAVAQIVAECSGPMGEGNGSWRQRKQATIDQVPVASPGALRVELADKLHNARAILADYRRIGDDLWTRFNAPNGRDDVVWYYDELALAFRRSTSGPLLDELERTVTALRDLDRDEMPHFP